ncbi:hypothetical protein Amsp01_105230 [Amycolatopsis sp. NBRC 101858]|uniref:hypothetical protein n=1 Tax=Amycolatopsis sp. NBRC 101858 TaxID=3032200 RepID=UPI0024A29612|nr:hypothetical protein [Amycolatopsis sp. NBRC 101858]GLY44500.1 hypothetical protein Amsp01_105230 [Amycolatopsis sp. NBRC 101858]
MRSTSPVRVIGAALFVLAGFFATWFASAPADAADTVTAAATPEQVSLVAGGTAAGALTIVNGGAEQVSVDVRPVPSDTSLKVELASRSVVLAVGASGAVEFSVTRTAEGSGQDTSVTFIVGSPRGTTSAVLAVKAAASPVLVETKIDSAVDRINENRPGSASLVIGNPRDSDVEVTSLDVTAPASTSVSVLCPGGTDVRAEGGHTVAKPDCAFGIGARQQLLLPITFTASDLVTPGPRALSIVVHVAGPTGTKASVVAATTFTVDVFGESEILQAVGFPVFLVLPGVLFVLTSFTLIRRCSPWRSTTPVGDQTGGVVGTTAVTGILGVAFSFAIALLYPWLTAEIFPRYRRDYWHAYGFLDFYFVFAYSVLLGVAVWLVACLLFFVNHCRRAALIPQPGDTERVLLRKLGLRGFLGRDARFLRVRAGDDSGVLLAKRGGRVLVAPRIVTEPALTDKSKIEALATSGNTLKLWWALRRQSANDRLRYKAGDIAEVAEMPNSEVTIDRQPVALVEVSSSE